MGPVILRIAIIALLIATVSSDCRITTQISRCNYTVVCDRTDSMISMPECGETYIKLLFTNINGIIFATSNIYETNFDREVRSVVFINNTWFILANSTLKYFYNTITMDISNNNVQEIQTRAFYRLNRLDSLNISYNLLESLKPETFYNGDEPTLNVRVLDLSHNKLKKLSSELTLLTKLEKLFLQGNSLHNLESNCFRGLNSLLILDLGHNSLYTLNDSLTSVNSLSKLYINHNQLTGILSSSICSQINLRILNASHNFISGIRYDCFKSALNLSVVDFRFNNINTSIYNEMFKSNKNLKYVDFYNNNIDVLGTNVFANNSPVTFINLDKNNLGNALTANNFVGLKNITSLQITNQRISSITERTFDGMSRLEYLNLTRNKITFIANSSFANSSVVKLDLSYNLISSLNCFKGLLTLTELYLNNNNITVVPKFSFLGLTRLKILDLSMNFITTFEKFALPLVELQYLNITGNRLDQVTQNNISNSVKISRYLDMSNLNISKIDAMTFWNLSNLTSLNLSHNQVDFIDPNNFVGFDNMHSLDVSHNRLKHLAFNGNVLSNLKAIYLNNNELTNISTIFSDACQLSYLDSSHNNIRYLFGIGSNIFPKISVLRLSHNNIEKFNNPQTNTLISLVILDLSFNKITDITLKYYSNLEYLNLSNNNLKRIDSAFFDNADSIEVLDLSHNNIRSLPPRTFHDMSNLTMLNLSSNFISILHEDSLGELENLSLLDLSLNNLYIIKAGAFDQCVKLTTLILDYNFLNTSDVINLPNNLFALETLSVRGTPCAPEVNNSITVFCDPLIATVDEIMSPDNDYDDDEYVDINNSSITTPVVPEPTQESDKDLTTIILVTCSVALVIVIGLLIIHFKIFRRRGFLNINGSRIEMETENIAL